MVNGDWQFNVSRDTVRKYLDKSTASRILVSAIFDPSALEALQAFKDADHLQDCAIFGQNGSIEALLQMRKPNSRLIGSVDHFPERYGGQLIALALDILTQHVPVPNAVFIKHQLLILNNTTGTKCRRENSVSKPIILAPRGAKRRTARVHSI